jgi:hypothetical protein
LVFLGLVLLGLPLAMALGGRLADRPATPQALKAPAGAGALGAAPTRTQPPATPITFDYRPDDTGAETRNPTGAVAAPTTPKTAAPAIPTSTTTTPAGLPTLPTGGIPVPTPTEIDASSQPPSPSPAPSDSKDPQPPQFDRAHWLISP